MAASSVDKTPVALVRNYNDVAALVLQGKAFVITNPTIDTGVVGQTSYAATLATFALRNLGSKVMVPLYCLLSQTGTVGGGRISCHTVALRDDQYTSGTAVTPVNLNSSSGDGSTVLASHTATIPTITTGNSAQVATIDIFQTVSAAGENNPTNAWPFPGFVAVRAGGSLLVYTDATITGPAWFFNIAWAELEV